MESGSEVGKPGNLCIFVGVALPYEIREALAGALRGWRRQYPEIAWEEAEALHLTLQFIGSYPAARLAELESALQGVVAARFQLRCAGTGAFPDGKRPRVIWAGVERTPALLRLAKAIPAALEAAGIVAERRPFTPHVSLARVKPPSGLRGWAADAERPEWGEAEIGEFQLFETRSGGPRASRYAVLRRFAINQSR